MVDGKHEICVSFVHGFHDHVPADDRRPRPALWTISAAGERTLDYCFPFQPVDFDRLPYAVVGERPPSGAAAGGRLPRYGFTGLARTKAHLLAGSWNGIYRLDADTKRVDRFITNRCTCYIHRFYADDEHIIFVMPFRDLVVIMDHEGAIVDRFTVDRRLELSRDLPDPDVDWRFVTKPWPGSTGVFHFNSVQKIGDQLYLLSRNLGAFVVIDPGARRASLRTLNYWTPTCVHDGDFRDGRFYLSSIDGKILIAGQPPDYDPSVFQYDLQVECVRLDAAEKNWCRGMAVTDDFLYTTVDGRYDTDLSFGLLRVGRDGAILDQRRFRWGNVGDEKDIRYVTGFDILLNPMPCPVRGRESAPETLHHQTAPAR
jgi:hypothetical protein